MYPNHNYEPPSSSSPSTINNSFQFHPPESADAGAATPWSTVLHHPAPPNGLIRQTSSPAAFYHQHFMSHLGTPHTEGGHESYNDPQLVASSRKNRQSLFSSGQLSFANYEAGQVSSTPRLKKASTSSASSSSQRFTIGPWEQCTDQPYDSQVNSFEAGSRNTLSNVSSEDRVAWKIRAKRGFATHPRSIAERERRNKINCKLKTLQELLPNIDKQASYADMLDLAVEHVKVLQCQIQELSEELNNCKCGCIKRN